MENVSQSDGKWDSTVTGLKLNNQLDRMEVIKSMHKRGGLLSCSDRPAFGRRMYHTGSVDAYRHQNHVQSKTTEKYRKYLIEDRKKMTMPVKAVDVLKHKAKSIQNESKATPWQAKLEQTRYKVLNASAKQKFRSFNVQRKFSPSASVLLMMDKNRKEKLEKNNLLTVRKDEDKEEETTKEESEPKEVEEKVNDVPVDSLETTEETEEQKNQLVPKKENDETERYKEFILKQLQDLKRENEQLKKRLMQIIDNKKMVSALQVQTDNLELEKTKLKACWLVMLSTMDAFSNFCRKFTSKSDADLPMVKERDEENEEFQDALETHEPEKKEESYDEKYYNFLNKLMQDQVEEEKTRKRAHAGK